MEDFETLDRYFRVANYLSAAQLYLTDNPLLERPLCKDDVKKRIVGHWGTVPGQNFIYTHLSRAVNKFGNDIILISGPGHGGNFFVSNAYIEGTYSEIYPHITKDKAGLRKLFKQFSFPCGISSHVAPEVPGSMHEGGELGYSLAHGFGAVLDSPNTIAAVIVGDGEAETGPLAASWWGTKFLNRETDGTVLPILHLNGYKIANPTILARISQQERQKYFEAFGYEVIELEVGNGDIMADHAAMSRAVDYAVSQIRKKRLPMIILKSPKGWTGVDVADGKQITGSFRAHQVPVDMSKPEHLDIVEKWLMSYRPQELFNPDGSIQADILSLCPNGNRRISANKITYGGRQYSPLRLPDIKKYFVNTEHKQQDMSVLSGYVAELIKLNPQTFRFFSPDEAKSNRLYAPFTVTKRVWGEELLSTDEDLAAEGRIIDSVLSEHLCEGMLEGYTLTGRHGFFASYEAFARVVDSMLTQHTKWLKLTKDMPWRTPLPCLNLIATSHSWQQDHNGFTHQDPGIAAHLLDKDPTVVRCYYPADANSLLCVFEKCMKDTNKLNLITASKHASIQWRTGEQAMNDVKNGISVWQECKNPDVVLACCGDTPTLECVKAVKILHDKNPELKIRLVNVIDLGTVATNTDIFTHDRPVVFVHHGYVNIIKALVSGHKNPDRFTVLGYREEGAITTGFDMRVLNKIDRYHIANIISPDEEYTQKLREHKAYIAEFGVDPDWI